MDSVIITGVMLLISLWLVAYLIHEDIRHLEILVRQIDETVNNKL